MQAKNSRLTFFHAHLYQSLWFFFSDQSGVVTWHISHLIGQANQGDVEAKPTHVLITVASLLLGHTVNLGLFWNKTWMWVRNWLLIHSGSLWLDKYSDFLTVNYRGSTGFGQNGVLSLLGGIGTQDVKDVEVTVEICFIMLNVLELSLCCSCNFLAFLCTFIHCCSHLYHKALWLSLVACA